MKHRFRLPPIPLFHLEPLEPRRTLNAGFLDPTIVPGGAVTLELGVDLKHLQFDDQPAIIQPNGKIVVLAEAWGSQADCSPNIDGDIGDLAILFSRFNADGSRDSSFGTNGVATVPCMVDYAYNPILQPDGKLLIIGPYDGIIRITADGQRDPSFQSQGREYSGMFWDSNLDWMTLAPDGKLLVQGKEVTGFTNGEEEDVGLTKIVPFLVEEEMLKLGAIFSKKANWAPHVVSDGPLITGQNPHSSGPAANTLLASVKERAWPAARAS